MKVVLFCGGLGMRIREYSDGIPKPMVPIGSRPILWHLMKYYAHYGHTEFILCLGYRAEVIKDYFLHYDEAVSNDFVLSQGGSEIELLSSDIDDWKITFVDTGEKSSVGERLRKVQEYLGDDEYFLANYADGLSDLHLPSHIEHAVESGSIGYFLGVHSPQSFHIADITEEGTVGAIAELSKSDLWINGGFFVFRREIFDYLNEGEDLVGPPFARLIEEGRLGAYRYNGFWMAMDTFKDRVTLVDLYHSEDVPWMVWETDKRGRP